MDSPTNTPAVMETDVEVPAASPRGLRPVGEGTRRCCSEKPPSLLVGAPAAATGTWMRTDEAILGEWPCGHGRAKAPCACSGGRGNALAGKDKLLREAATT